jgi:periplasmic protein TonB
MASNVPKTGAASAGSKRSTILCVVGGLVLFLGLGAGAYFLLGWKSAPKKRVATVVSITPLPPPPPPKPTPPPTPPPDMPEPVQQPDAPKFVEETQPDSPPEPEPEAPAPMGSNIQGDGPPDGFGLQGRGGGGMIGGTGRGGGGGSQFGWYAGRVQNAVSSAVRSHKLTRSARMTIKARIWVDASGRVTRAALEGSSGDAAVDRALQGEILTGITFPDPPPQGMPMPIVMRINASR